LKELPAFAVVARCDDEVKDVDATVGPNFHLDEDIVGLTKREDRCISGF